MEFFKNIKRKKEKSTEPGNRETVPLSESEELFREIAEGAGHTALVGDAVETAKVFEVEVTSHNIHSKLLEKQKEIENSVLSTILDDEMAKVELAALITEGVYPMYLPGVNSRGSGQSGKIVSLKPGTLIPAELIECSTVTSPDGETHRKIGLSTVDRGIIGKDFDIPEQFEGIFEPILEVVLPQSEGGPQHGDVQRFVELAAPYVA